MPRASWIRIAGEVGGRQFALEQEQRIDHVDGLPGLLRVQVADLEELSARVREAVSRVEAGPRCL